MIRFAALYLLASVAFAAPAVQDETVGATTLGALPPGWVAGDPPSTEGELSCANRAGGWRVARSGNDGITISPGEPSHATFSIALDDGVMWATNHGEFGGRVEWQAAGGGERVLIAGGNPVAFMPLQNAVFVAEGLSHGASIRTPSGTTEFLGELRKQVVKMVRSDGSWKADGAIPLEMVPGAVLQSGEHAVILANRGVIAADLRTMQASVVHRNDDWSGLYPNSIVEIDHDSFLIGLRSAVVKLSRHGTSLEEQWWRPAACARMQPVPNSKCSCLPPP